MSTPLRVFIAISILLHVTLVGFIVVPSILGLFRPHEVPLTEEQVMLQKQRVVEKVTQETAREEVKKELIKALKEDVRSATGDLPPAKFEQIWTNALAALQTNINDTAAQLAQGSLTDLTPQQLEAAMRGLREAEIDALMAQLGNQSKDEIAAQVLAGVAATVPEFNQKTKELMDNAESPKVKGEVDKLLAEERNRRNKELTAANSGLAQAQQQVDQAKAQSAAIGSSLARTLGDNQKRADAAARADATVEQALQAAADAERNTAALDKALAAKAAADEAAAQSDALLKEAGKRQAELEKSIAGAQTALQEAATQAGQAKAFDAKAGLADAAATTAKAANDSVKAAAAAIQANNPTAATAASEKTAAALAEATRMVDDMANLLAAAATGTNAAAVKAAGAALKSATSATNQLEKAVASARATAAATRQADQQRRDSLVTATEPSRGEIAGAVKDARAAVDHALQTATDEKAKNAARTLRDAATALSQVLAPATAELEKQLGRTNLTGAADQAGKVAAELKAAARKVGDEAAALAQEAGDRKSPALAKEAAALNAAARDLRDAEARAQRVAEAVQQAAAPAGAKHDAHASVAKASVTEAQEAVRTALEGAAKDLRSTAAPLTDKAEKPVADALAAAARQTDAVLNGPVKRTGELMAANSTKAAQQATAQTHAAISNLVSDLAHTRSDLSNMTGKPTTDEVNVARAAHNSLEGVSKTLDRAEDHLEKAAAAADKGSEASASRVIELTARNLSEAGQATVAHASDALSPKPPDARIPEDWPRPGRKEMSIAQRDMDSATNRLAGLSRLIGDEKAFLGGAAMRFESNFVRSVDAALTEDPALRQKTRDFVRQALREKVATEFRAKTEDLVGKVLEKKGMERDERFIKRVGQQASEMLLAGSESNLLDNAFGEILAQTAKRFGVKPEEMRKELAAEDGTDDGEEVTDDAQGPDDGTQKDGTGKKKKKHKKSKGPAMPGADANGGEADSGMDAVNSALEKSLARSLQSGTQNAISSGAKSSLHLPGVEAFGESQSDSLRQRMAGARGGAMRSLATGGREAFIAGMSDNLAKLGQSLRTGASNGRRNGMFDNPAEYRRNLEEVIKGREVKEIVLVAPSLTNTIAAATSEVASNRPSLILVGSRRDLRNAATNAAETTVRTLVPPEFKNFAYGGAPFTTNPPTIDGDLSDWAGVRPFALRGTLKKSLWSKPFPEAWETNRYLLVQWDYTGLYFAYQLVDEDGSSDVGAPNFWEGDCLELWVDFSNRRTDERSEDQQQFWFWPFGAKRVPGSFGGEVIMPGYRIEPRYRNDSRSPRDPKMVVKPTTNPRGYAVEIYMPLACFLKPDLTPGRVIAFDFSIHNGEGAYLRWTTELGKSESMTPSVWGDLALLGSDAEIQTVKPKAAAETLTAIIPGEPLGVRLTDVDMNTDPRVRNQVKVRFETGEGHALIGYLQETDVNTGIFEGSIDTVEVVTGEDREIGSNALPIISGGYVEISYYDQARRYGERNFTARKRVPVGVPVMRMATRK